MKFRFLITISDDVSALYGVRFIASFLQHKEDVDITLLYVANSAELTEMGSAFHPFPGDMKPTEAHSQKGEAAIESACALLKTHGFPEEAITTRLVSKRFGTVKDISREARSGLYDAVILGRRGYALFEKTFSSSVSREMMEHRINFPVWVCRLPEEGRKNVLLCVDDSEPCLRMADHVGFILEKETEHSVTLFHVDTGEFGQVSHMMAQAREQLLMNHVPEERIRELVVHHSRVIPAILEEADHGRYAALAVGRGGREKKGLFEKWLTGSISMKLLEVLEKATLWVSK